jgi:transposase
MSTNKRIVGVDISKHKADVYFLEQQQHRLIEAKNYPEFTATLQEYAADLVVMEATGGYERLLAGHIAAAGIPLAIVNPRQVRDFAKATNQLAKTDAIDARIIALFAQAITPRITVLPDADMQSLRNLLERRRQLVAMRVAEANREMQTYETAVKNSVKTMLQCIDKQLTQIKDELDDRIRKSPIWQESIALLTSIPGVGETTAMQVLAEMPELGGLSRQQVGALAGLAPINHDSGKFRGQRRIRGGRVKLRTALYMATMSATRFNPTIRTFYMRLKQAGKKGLLAITACMRKLLIIMNSMMKNKTTFCQKTS